MTFTAVSRCLRGFALLAISLTALATTAHAQWSVSIEERNLIPYTWMTGTGLALATSHVSGGGINASGVLGGSSSVQAAFGSGEARSSEEFEIRGVWHWMGSGTPTGGPGNYADTTVNAQAYNSRTFTYPGHLWGEANVTLGNYSFYMVTYATTMSKPGNNKYPITVDPITGDYVTDWLPVRCGARSWNSGYFGSQGSIGTSVSFDMTMTAITVP